MDYKHKCVAEFELALVPYLRCSQNLKALVFELWMGRTPTQVPSTCSIFVKLCESSILKKFPLSSRYKSKNVKPVQQKWIENPNKLGNATFSIYIEYTQILNLCQAMCSFWDICRALSGYQAQFLVCIYYSNPERCLNSKNLYSSGESQVRIISRPDGDKSHWEKHKTFKGNGRLIFHMAY